MKLKMLGTSGAARALGTPENRVRVYADTGRLPHIRDDTGRRLFRPEDVIRLKAELAASGEAVEDE
jgi:DNA-binding transcriptional MerR regulator